MTRDQVLPQTLGKGRWNGELHLRHFVSAAAIPVIANVFVIDHLHTGMPTSIAVVSHDASDVVSSQRELRRLNRELADLVARRTSELSDLNETLEDEGAERRRAEAQLREVQLELYRIARVGAAGQMAASIAHELSEPLTAATNMIGAARRIVGSGTGNHAQSLEAIEDAASQIHRAAEILHRLREFIGHGGAQRQIEDVAGILDDAVAFAMVDADTLGIRLSVHRDPAASKVYVDRVQVQQVLVNLMRNAIEAMADSARRELKIEVSRRPDSMVEIAVADSGPGVSREVTKRLFDPFVTTKEHGMGLGLSISKSLVHANGGELTTSPGTDGGAVFRFTLASGPGGAIG
jgi:C4-dicarboxylate-specific signal transduction histidine kinase